MVLSGSSSGVFTMTIPMRDKPSMANSSSSGSSNNSKYASGGDDRSFYGSVLDQLHAEQKSTIEALTCQVEFYRQREERYKKELETLRRCLAQVSGKAGKEDGTNAVVQLAMETRKLGEELDMLRSKQSRWESEKARYEQQKDELEHQLQDAKQSLARFSQAIEQLELKLQRKEAEVQTKYLTVEQDLLLKSQECERLTEENQLLQQRAENLQTASGENERLRSELQLLKQAELMQQSEKETASIKFASELQTLHSTIHHAEESKRQQDALVLELQKKLAAAVAETSSTHLETEKLKLHIKELELQLENSSHLISLREKLLSSDDHARKESESQRQELLMLISTLQREKEQMQVEISMLHKERDTIQEELRSVKSRLSSKDHSVMVSTLRSEIVSLKERLRNEFKQEKDTLRHEKQQLNQEVVVLKSRLAEKDRLIHRLQDEILERDANEKQTSHDIMHLREKISNLEGDLEVARDKYQQLQDCRTSLAEKLDFGFKELLNDEENAASAYKQVEKLGKELTKLKKEHQALESQHQSAVDELERVKAERHDSYTRLNAQIDDLYAQLQEKEDIIVSLKKAERQVFLFEQEKSSWEGQLTDIRLRWERRVEAEVRKVDDLRSKIDSLEQNNAALKMQITDLENELLQRDELMHSSQMTIQQKGMEIDSLQIEQARLKHDLSQMEAKLSEAANMVERTKNERTSREKKLLRERKQMEADMTKLVQRIESAATRNTELGDKVISLANQSKIDQTDLIALSSQVKSYKHKMKQLEDEMSKIRQRTGHENDKTEDLRQQLSEAICLKESYQLEINKLRKSIEQGRNENEVVHKQRDEAMKRVRVLIKCQEQIKSTVEDHTAELVEEIESIQDQLENERNRCNVLLANEKNLLRDLQDRHTMITKLQKTITSLQQKQSTFQSEKRNNSNVSMSRTSNSSATPRNTYDSPRHFAEKSPAKSPQQPREQQRNSQHMHKNSPQTTSPLAPAKELDHLLSNLEHISEFSAQQHQQQFLRRQY